MDSFTIRLWKDSWCISEPLMDLLNVPPMLNLKARTTPSSNAKWWLEDMFNLNSMCTTLDDVVDLMNDIQEFTIIRKVSINTHPKKQQVVRVVCWKPPAPVMVKCNVDGDARGTPARAACGLPQGNAAEFMGSFCAVLGLATTLNAELTGAMMAGEITTRLGE
ncbi:hypothetical protein VNO80_29926 [Phaseolus coccineus]|uniref:RNase H type-1 domain-containing protein n=1 Tax=Phaseolus coccineus TaxID=3886 RepID=A0AAN9LCY4_PHACN